MDINMKKLILFILLTSFLLGIPNFSIANINMTVEKNDGNFSKTEIKKIADYHVNEYLHNKIMDKKVATSNEWIPHIWQ
jgi:hypothetical protein